MKPDTQDTYVYDSIAHAFQRIASDIADLVTEKNAAYGNSIADTPCILKYLYPDGVHPKQYKDMLTIVRIIDKLKRIATDKDAFGENPWKDIAGYAIVKMATDAVTTQPQETESQ